MSFLQRFILSNRQDNSHLNHIACIENDYAGKSCEQLFQILCKEQNPDIIAGIKKLLTTRGYSKKEIQTLTEPQSN